jgi:hypothetical protein
VIYFVYLQYQLKQKTRTYEKATPVRCDCCRIYSVYRTDKHYETNSCAGKEEYYVAKFKAVAGRKNNPTASFKDGKPCKKQRSCYQSINANTESKISLPIYKIEAAHRLLFFISLMRQNQRLKYKSG